MPDEYRPYGVTQNADADRTTANALVGEPIPWTTGNSVVGGPALFSTAPYKPPRQTWFGCVGKNSTCKARPISGTDLCVFHTPGQALPPREWV